MSGQAGPACANSFARGCAQGLTPRGRGTPQDLRPQFRLRPGQDDVLIDWLRSIAPRRRSQVIRDALFDYLAGRARTGGDCWEEDPDLAAALDSLF